MSVELDLTADNLRALGYRPLVAGDDYNMKFTIQRDGTAIDLTSGKVWFTVKDDPIVPDVDAKLQMDSSVSADIEITDAANGKFTVKFQGTGSKGTENLEGEWKYDIQVKLAAGTLITVGRGDIEFLPNMTRTTT